MDVKEGEGGGGSCGFCFFKVFLKDDLRPPFQLMLPTKFVMEHGNDLLGFARLRVPVGDSWEVKLRKEGGKVWLQDGWADIMKHYGIGHGHFVVFDYQGGSRFDMVIFDTTACEIEYPFKADHGKRPRPADEEEPPLVPKPEQDTDERENNTQAGMFADHMNSDSMKLYTPLANVAGGALSRAASYHCRWPSVFIVLGKSSVHPAYTLSLPKQFSKVCCLEGTEFGNIRLQNTDGHTWLVRYVHKDRFMVTRGWKQFVTDNDLRLGDVCVFELIDKTKLLVRVVIFPGDKVLSPCRSSDKTKLAEDSITLSDEITAGEPFGEAWSRRSTNKSHTSRPVENEVGVECPSFKVVVCKSSAEGNFLHVPNSFSRCHLQGTRVSRKSTLKFGKSSWPIELANYGSPTAVSYRMIGGWGEFARDNDLQEKDVCVFKLVRKECLVFEVSIEKH